MATASPSAQHDDPPETGGFFVGPGLFVGLISGTSADGIDAALVRFDDAGGALQCEVLHARTTPWPDDLRRRLVVLGQGGSLDSLEELGTLEGYVNIPLGQIEKRLKEIPKDKAIITA